MRTRIKSHVGCCYLLATAETHIINNKTKKAIVTRVTKKAVFKSDFLTPSERENEEHFRELLKMKEAHKHNIFKD